MSQAPATTSSSSPAYAPRSPSFAGLAVVERQLILQLLDFQSLSRVYCCSRQLREEALHPRAASFLVPVSGYSGFPRAAFRFSNSLSQYWLPPPDDRASPLVFAQLPVSLSVENFSNAPPVSADTVPAITSRLSLFNKVHQLELGNAQWPKEVAVQLLQHASLNAVHTVNVQYGGSLWLTNADVQLALFSLPSLTCVHLDCALNAIQPASLAAASRLRSLDFEVKSADFRLLLPLCALPLQCLSLRTLKPTRHSHVCSIPLPQLTQLWIYWAPRLSHAHARALFSQLPALTELFITDSDIDTLMLGCGDAGQSGLPALRRCTVRGSHVPSVECVRRFLWRFPRLDSLVFAFSTQEPSAGQWLQRFSRWGPPVKLDCEPFAEQPPPQPHSDDQIVEEPSEITNRDEQDDSDEEQE